MSDTQTSIHRVYPRAQDFLPLLGTDFIELYVGNCLQAAHYYQTAFGFQPLAYAGLKTGLSDRESYVLEQGKIRIVLTSPLHSRSAIGKHIDTHGDGVFNVALTVEDATQAYREVLKRGAQPYQPPKQYADEHGEVVCGGIRTYGETVHLFVERKAYKGCFLPGFIP